MPGMGGTNGFVPVAITKWAPSRRVPSSSSTACGLTNRARASKTSTPRPSNRSTESLGAMRARRSRMCSKTRWNRNRGSIASSPWASASRMLWISFEVETSALEGTHP